MNIKIVYFSGTGCTAYVAKKLSEAFNNKNIKNSICEIFQNNMPSIDNWDIVILMFPVYAGDAPYPIYKWISSLPKSTNKKAIIISVSGGGEITPNTDCRTESIHLFEKKGFNVTNEYMICMPANFITATEKNLVIKLIQVLPKKCEIITNEIIQSINRRKKVNFQDKIIRFLCKPEKLGSRFFGKTIKVNKNCNTCSLCAKKCPVENIKMVNSIPKFNWKCTLCMRCIYDCPQKALKPIIMNFCVIKGGFSLDIILENAKAASKSEIIDFSDSKLWNGVNKYVKDIDVV